MSRSIARIASLVALAVVAAVFAATALADNGNGKDNGNSANAPGQTKQAGEPAQPQAAQPQAAQPQAAQPVAQSSTAPGIKPSNSTEKHTKCTTGGGTGTSATCTSSNPKTTNADASKRYGNGKTAAQIGNSHGAPAGTVISGPGNSQPHKVAVCPGKTNKSGGRDVHAVKSYSTANCAPAQETSATSSSAVSASTQAPAQVPAPTQASSSSASSESVSESQLSQSHSASVQSVAAPAPMNSPGAESGVLGAIKALPTPTSVHANAGVLGTIARISGGTLPFSGFPLWTALVAALALLTAGALLRRRSA